MSVLKKIAEQLENKFVAIDIFSPEKGKYIARDIFKKDALINFESVEDYLLDFNTQQGLKSVWVYFKKRNGESKGRVSFKKLDGHVSVSFGEQEEIATPKDTIKENVTPNNPTPIIPTPTMDFNFEGMAGGPVLQLYSKADKFDDAKKLADKLEIENSEFKKLIDRQKDEIRDFKYEKRTLEDDVKKAKEKLEDLKEKLEAKGKPVLNNDHVTKIITEAPNMLGMAMAAFQNAKKTGMASPANNDVEILSDAKKQLVEMIKVDQFTDELATDVYSITNGIFTNQQLYNEISILMKKYQL